MSDHRPAAEDMDFLRYLADQSGVATSYWDWYGQRCHVSAYTLLYALESLGAPLDQAATVEDLHAAHLWVQERPWRDTLPPTVVVREGSTRDIPVHVPHGSTVTVSYMLEDGSTAELPQIDHWVDPRQIDGLLTGRATFQVPATLPQGWHTLHAHLEDGTTVSSTLIVVPNSLQPAAVADDQRKWGIAAQMYSTRSHTSWGMGDAQDLADLATYCAQQGADFLLINPVHAQAPVSPIENSPYLPVTRRWVNPIYIRPEAIAEYEHADALTRSRIEALRETTLGGDAEALNRDRTWSAKMEALELVFALPRSAERESAFQAFCQAGGHDLDGFALWSAIAEEAGTIAFPADMDCAARPASTEAAKRLAPRLEFWKWLQWVAREQLTFAHAQARQSGMEIGLMADLAVGIHPAGSEKWAEPEIFAPGMQVGAPPDMYSQQGQDWSQPPWSPIALATVGYRPLRDMLRAVLSHCGAVRIDHILGLFRLWWIPKGRPASEGTYVHYDHEAMVGVLLLEAARAGAVVIGEDLGTVEPWVRQYLTERGILGTSVVWFEKEDSGWPLHADHYRKAALSTVNTHDLPPTAGYLKGVHTTLRDQLGLLVDDVETLRQADREEIEQMCVRLREYGLMGAEDPTDEELIHGLYRYVAQTPSVLVGVSLVDAVGDERPQNLPGTDQPQYPNWRMPLTDGDGKEVFIEDLADNQRAAHLFEVMRRAIG